jgi:hypothetical protein
MFAATSLRTTTEVDLDRVASTAGSRGRRFGLMLAGALVTVALTASAVLAATDFLPRPTATDLAPGPTATCSAWHWSAVGGHGSRICFAAR